MKKHLFLLVISLYFFSLQGQTPIPAGDVSGIWDIQGSPYQIEGNVTVPNASTLIIEPGVKVEFQDSYTMFVQGCVLAQGTVSDSIFFTAADTAVGFKSIRYLNTPRSNDSSKYEYCSFTYGRAHGPYPDNWGGAFGAMGFGKIIIEHCRFAFNKAIWYTAIKPGGAAAIALLNCSPVIRNCLFENNTGCIGAVLCLSGNDTTLVENNIFRNNNAPFINSIPEGLGGAILCKWNSKAIIRGNIFENNHAGRNYGAIFCWNNGNARIENNLFYGNTAELDGGAIGLDSCSSPTIINNTIANNTAGMKAGGIFIIFSSSPEIYNTILWGNTAGSGNQVYIHPQGGVGEPDFYYCNVQGGKDSIGGEPFSGEYIGCMNENPLFSSAGEHPYSLLEFSPCIDKGSQDTIGLSLLPWDLVGNFRIWDGDGNGSAIIDIGAYEYDAPTYLGIENFQLSKSNNKISSIIYPNPLSSETTISWMLPEPSKVIISILNTHGQVINRVEMFKFSGEHKYIWDAGGQPAGIYYYKIQTPNGIGGGKALKVL